jgi:hypothetical protein
MKRLCILAITVFYLMFTTCVRAVQVEGKVFSESVLIDAFEKGRSLVVAEVLSTIERESVLGNKSIKEHFYRVRVILPIIAGDLAASDTRGLPELGAGVSYGDVLKPGATYALFITKDCPYQFSWCHRDDVIEVNTSEKRNLQALIEAANRAYKKTLIREFRGKKLLEKTELPVLSDEIVSLCENFKSHPINRAEFAKRIYESDLGSRPDESQCFRSYLEYSPPQIVLSREQIVCLLGEPSHKCGWTYSWLCGQDKSVTDSENYVGVFSVIFDKNEKGTCVLYYPQDREKWVR